MDFRDQIKELGEKVGKLKDSISTEEATKNALIMPFIRALGYDVFNPFEVVPEYVADIGIKKGEKIDYAILMDSKPIILVECKHWKQNLVLHDGQLLRYFHVSKARFGILTNGIVYRFYTDLENPNKMDEKPFFEFRLDEIKDDQIEKLKEFHKSYFNLESILNTASELKYKGEIRNIILKELQSPSDDFTRYFAKQVYDGSVTAKVLEQFKEFVKGTFTQYINDAIDDRLTLAMNKQNLNVSTLEEPITVAEPVEASDRKAGVETTQEELDSFYTIKAILRNTVDVNRIALRDGVTYCSILLDDNNRKPICRLNYKGTKKFVVAVDASRQETRFEMNDIDDFYKHADLLIACTKSYESPTGSAQPARSEASTDGHL